ncbi:MAG TPA: hypothetical protein ENN09_00815 [Planctomycetes bacterium]|nr:hypothetical protein [Planctomycetota bacterium]
MSTEGMKYVVSLHGEETVECVIRALDTVSIELPSWGFGRGGTRFAVYHAPEDAQSLDERIRRAARVRDLTGCGDTLALHFPWDGSSGKDVDWLAVALREHGLRAGAVNPNLFSMRPKDGLNDRLRFGGFTSPLEEIEAAALEHCRWCVEVMRRLGSRALSLWLPDGTNSPGQQSLYEQANLVEEAVHAVAKMLNPEEILLLEYKFFEPAFYATAVPDWGRASEIARKSGENVHVLVDLGHHAPGTNVEQIVAFLVREGRLGGFHLNDSNYADDDLATGSIDASRLFRIMLALVEGEWRGLKRLSDVAFMIDESHNVKDATAEMVESVVNIETALARALLVSIDAWTSYTRKGRTPKLERAEQELYKAFNTDVRPILQERRRRKGLPEDPLREIIG